jgi:hypothetical protein
MSTTFTEIQAAAVAKVEAEMGPRDAFHPKFKMCNDLTLGHTTTIRAIDAVFNRAKFDRAVKLERTAMLAAQS